MMAAKRELRRVLRERQISQEGSRMGQQDVPCGRLRASMNIKMLRIL